MIRHLHRYDDIDLLEEVLFPLHALQLQSNLLHHELVLSTEAALHNEADVEIERIAGVVVA